MKNSKSTNYIIFPTYDKKIGTLVKNHPQANVIGEIKNEI
jgi:hypothetical protein